MLGVAGIGLAVALAALWLLAGGAGATPVVGTDVLYTTDADFDQGTLVNVNHDAPNSNQLQLNTVTSTFPFIWISLSLRCTIAKINTETGAILGEYRTISDTASTGCNQSSRTTVGLDGSVWVGHRGPGGVTHVGLAELNQCVDRNSNGTIETSTGYGDVKAWPGSSSNAALAADECILHHVNTDAVFGGGFGGDSRHMSIDASNNLWVGNFSPHEFIRINGSTGVIETPVRSFACGGYGGLIDSDGVIWSANGGSSGLLRWDPDAPDGPTNPRCLSVPGVYGLAIDETGYVWVSQLFGNAVWKVSPDGNTILGPFVHGYDTAQGLAVTPNGDVWVSSSLFCGVGCPIGHLQNNGSFVGNVSNPTGAGSTGIAVDAAGKIWSANLNSNTATRIDPTAGPIGGGGIPIGAVDLTVSFPNLPCPPAPAKLSCTPSPYNYSDMTGAQLLGSTAPQGTWTVVQDGGSAGAQWGTITWNTEPEGSQPPGTTITVEARAADSEAGLGGESYVAVSNGLEFSLAGRYVQVRVTMQPDEDGNSPILSDIRIEGGAEADISVEKSAPSQVTEGESFSYSLLVSNAGPDEATNVTVTDTLPEGVTYDSSSSSQGSCAFASGVVTCDLGAIAPGASATVTIDVTASGEGPYVNSTSASADEDDPDTANNSDTTTTSLNHHPDCSGAAISGPSMWPPNHTLQSFTLGGFTDEDGDPVSITVTAIDQDEPVDATGNGDGNTSPDAVIGSGGAFELRAERAGGSDGRVYRVSFTASDGEGGTCSGSLLIGVPHDQGSGSSAVNSAPPWYSST